MLPPEDRLWRHPSEIAGATWNDAESTAVIGRWLSGEGSKGSVWTAGFVGALLAAGVVIVGAHLATAFTGPPLTGEHVMTTSAITMPSDASPNLGVSLAAAVTRVGHSIAVIDTQSATGVREQSLGVVIDRDGAVLTALAAVQGAATVLVDLPGTGITSVGKVVGRDKATGLAVVMVRGETDISSMAFSNLNLQRESFAVALTTPAGAANDPTLSLGALSAVNVTATTGDATLMDADMTDLSVGNEPARSAAARQQWRNRGNRDRQRTRQRRDHPRVAGRSGRTGADVWSGLHTRQARRPGKDHRRLRSLDRRC